MEAGGGEQSAYQPELSKNIKPPVSPTELVKVDYSIISETVVAFSKIKIKGGRDRILQCSAGILYTSYSKYQIRAQHNGGKNGIELLRVLKK